VATVVSYAEESDCSMRIVKTDAMKVPLKVWDGDGQVPMEEEALRQMERICQLPFIYEHAALMPDGHLGIGGAVGAVVPTVGAIVPAVVGVDLGCGMAAVRTTLTANDLPDSLGHVRAAIETEVPHGRTNEGGDNDKGSHLKLTTDVEAAWLGLKPGYDHILDRHPHLSHKRAANQLGSLGTGNHFIELCLDENNDVWIMLHSGSRGAGNKIGTYFTELAKTDMEKFFIHLPDKNLAYLPEDTEHFDDYVNAVEWAQNYAQINRELMLSSVVRALSRKTRLPPFSLKDEAVNCHHNYVTRENHFGNNVWVTRKGAVSAKKGRLGIIPGSMGTASFIVRGKGNPQSFSSCSHGAGRKMSRTEAKRTFTLKDHEYATRGVECRKDKDVIDETPGAYKAIETVISAQEDLIEVVHRLRQVLCVKG
jgi:tRNA-splicing ligase RtcB (3'-phosphate/5'-hydroxy nucleic acid ligase)